MSSLVQKILFVVLLSTFLFFSLAQHTVAQVTSQTNTTATPLTTQNFDYNVPYTQDTWVQSVMINVMSAMVCQLSGIDPQNPHQPCLGVNPSNGKLGLSTSNMGLLGLITNGIELTFTPPAHTADYAYYLRNNFGITKRAYADVAEPCSQIQQGIGYCSLVPLLPIWTTFRNLSYLGFVVVFILVGFAIMLRIKIRPQTVVTLQNSIPRIIIALVLITFSYAIAGFLIDVMYVTIGVIMNIAIQVDPTPPNGKSIVDILNSLHGDNPISFASQLIGLTPFANSQLPGAPAGQSAPDTAAHAIGNAAGDLITAFGTAGNFIAGFIGLLIGSKIAGAVTPIVGAAGSYGAIAAPIIGIVGTILGGVIFGLDASNITAYLGYVAATLILFVAILISLARVWLILIRAYITILLDVVFAPAWILLAVIPKSKFTFGSWMRDILANLSVFPLVVGIFLVAKVFIDAFNADIGTGNLFTPPLVGLNSVNGGGSILSAVIGLGFIFLAPSMLELSRSMFGAPKTGVISNTIQGVALGASVSRGLWSQTGGKLFGVDKNGNPRPITSIMGAKRREAALNRQEKVFEWQGSTNPLKRNLAKFNNWQLGISNIQKNLRFKQEFDRNIRDLYESFNRRNIDIHSKIQLPDGREEYRLLAELERIKGRALDDEERRRAQLEISRLTYDEDARDKAHQAAASAKSKTAKP